MSNADPKVQRKYKTLWLGVDEDGRQWEVDIWMEPKVCDYPSLSTDLEEATEYTELSLVGNVWHRSGKDIDMGGQISDAIRLQFPDDQKIQQLCDVWDRWHLNGMRAGTTLQNTLVRGYRERHAGRRVEYDEVCDFLRGENAYEDRGYRYGTKWLHENLPDDVQAFIRSLIEEAECQQAQADLCKNAECGHYVCTEGGKLGPWDGADPRYS